MLILYADLDLTIEADHFEILKRHPRLGCFPLLLWSVLMALNHFKQPILFLKALQKFAIVHSRRKSILIESAHLQVLLGADAYISKFGVAAS